MNARRCAAPIRKRPCWRRSSRHEAAPLVVQARERPAHQHQALVEDRVGLAERRLFFTSPEHAHELPAGVRRGARTVDRGGAQAELPGLALVPPDGVRLRVALAAAQAEPAAPAEHGGEQIPRRAIEGEARRGPAAVAVAVAVAVGEGAAGRAAERGEDHPVLGDRCDLDRHVGDGHAREGALALRHVLLRPHDLDLERPARAQRLTIQEIVERVMPRRRDPGLGAEGREHALPVGRARLAVDLLGGRAERSGSGRRPRPVFQAGAEGLLVLLLVFAVLVVRLLHLLSILVDDGEGTPAALDRLEVRGAVRGQDDRPDVLADPRLRAELAVADDGEIAVLVRERDGLHLPVHDHGVHRGPGSHVDGDPPFVVERETALPDIGREDTEGARAQAHDDGLLFAASRSVKGRLPGQLPAMVIPDTRSVGEAVALRRSRSSPTASIRCQSWSTLREMVTSLTG